MRVGRGGMPAARPLSHTALRASWRAAHSLRPPALGGGEERSYNRARLAHARKLALIQYLSHLCF
jgi:hypothetical protein